MDGEFPLESIIVDANLLLLLVVGSWSPQEIAKQKRLSGLTTSDFLLLTTFLSGFRKTVTTPHLLTEVSNLAGAATGMARQAIFTQFAETISALDERHLAATEIAATPEFKAFGLTDAMLSLLCRETVLVTADGRLAAHLQRKGWHAYTLDQVRALRDAENMR
jgi:hypothetical protein